MITVMLPFVVKRKSNERKKFDEDPTGKLIPSF